MIDKKQMQRILKKAKRINKEIEELKLIIAEDDDFNYVMDPSPFWIDTDIIPALKEQHGGELFKHRWFDDGTFSAELTIEGVKFRSDFVNMKEWDKYE